MVMKFGYEMCRPSVGRGLAFLLTGWLLGNLPGLGQAGLAGPGRVVTEYALTLASHGEFDDPKDWRLLGSNDDGRTWKLLDVQTNQSFRARSQRRVYPISNRAAFGMYRLHIDRPTSVQLAELELLGPVVGVAREADLYAAVSCSREDPVMRPAMQAFDNDPDTRWHGLADATGACWLQCQYTLDPAVLVTNLSQYRVLAQRAAARNPLGERGPEILSRLDDQATHPIRTLIGYALTSANDFPCRDPRNWRLEGSNDRGRTWTTLETRHNESFSTRFQRRVFMLANPARFAWYRLKIDSVRVPEGLPGGATCVQLAEIEPIYASDEGNGNGKVSIVVSAQGENAPMELATAAFDGNASTKWLDFAAAGGTNKSSWIQWQYLPGDELPVISLRWLSAVRTRPPQPIRMRLEGVAVAWTPQSRTLGFLDESGFQFFD